jgi:hypothetical protein
VEYDGFAVSFHRSQGRVALARQAVEATAGETGDAAPRSPGTDSNRCSGGNTKNEYLTIKNYSRTAKVNLKGYIVKDAAGNKYTFTANHTLEPGRASVPPASPSGPGSAWAGRVSAASAAVAAARVATRRTSGSLSKNQTGPDLRNGIAQPAGTHQRTIHPDARKVGPHRTPPG